MTKSKLIIASLLSTAVGVSGVRADEVEEQAQAGVRAYQEGQYPQAIQRLQAAASQIQDKLNRQYLALLPPPPAGWQAREGEAETAAMAMMGGGIHLRREYFRDAETVTVEMRANAPMLKALSAILSNPAMLAGNPAIQPYSFQGYKGIRKQLQDSAVEVSLLVGNTALVQLKGSGLKDDQSLQAFLQGLDFKKIERMTEAPASRPAEARPSGAAPP